MGKHRKEKEKKGLRVDVRYNNIEFALKRDAIKNGKGWQGVPMFVGMKLIPLKDLRVWGQARRQLIFIPAKGKGPVGKDISNGKYIKAHR